MTHDSHRQASQLLDEVEKLSALFAYFSRLEASTSVTLRHLEVPGYGGLLLNGSATFRRCGQLDEFQIRFLDGPERIDYRYNRSQDGAMVVKTVTTRQSAQARVVQAEFGSEGEPYSYTANTALVYEQRASGKDKA